MKITYQFKTDLYDAAEGTLVFHTKLPFYLFSKLIDRSKYLYKLLYHKNFLTNFQILDSQTEGTEFSIEYDQSRFCKKTYETPHQAGMGNSEDILHDSIKMSDVIQKAYSAAKMSEYLLEEYQNSEDLRTKMETLCKDASCDLQAILQSQCAIGVYESMIKQAMAFFKEKGNDDKYFYYRSLSTELELFIKKHTEIINDQIVYLTSMACPVCVSFQISELASYLDLLHSELSSIQLDSLTDVFEREFVDQFVRYIDSVHKN